MITIISVAARHASVLNVLALALSVALFGL